MKDSRLLPTNHRQVTTRLPPGSTNLSVRTDRTSSPYDPSCQCHPGIDEASLNVSASIFTRAPQGDGQSRITREQDDRATLEDKIRQAVDGWNTEERATAYWYLYACGMTLERAKAIRHKGGFNS